MDYCQGLYDEEGNELLSHYLAKEEIKNCLAKAGASRAVYHIGRLRSL